MYPPFGSVFGGGGGHIQESQQQLKEGTVPVKSRTLVRQG